MEARSKIRNASVAPRKARLVADLVRNQYVEDALSQLRFTHKAASPIIYKLIQSAAANAQHQDCLLYTSPSPRDRTRSRMPSSA